MLSVFPSLLAWNQFAPFIIRLTVGITLTYFGYQKTRSRGQSAGSNTAVYGAVEIFLSVFLIIGLFTQVAALLNAVILVIKLGFKAQDKKFLSDGINYYVLLLVMCLSLIVTGAGWWGFDLAL